MIRRILFTGLLAALFCTVPVSAMVFEGPFLKAGPYAMPFLNDTGLNRCISNYNAARSGLQTPMSGIHSGLGFDIGLATGYTRLNKLPYVEISGNGHFGCELGIGGVRQIANTPLSLGFHLVYQGMAGYGFADMNHALTYNPMYYMEDPVKYKSSWARSVCGSI
jgi:hypothetical protein